jgi:hypothetical protein
VAARLSPEQVPAALGYEWKSLQDIPSYVEGLIAANRGLIEGIATQW